MISTLETVQPDLFYKLASEPLLAGITIFKVREQDIESALLTALGGLGTIAQSGLPASFVRPGTGMGASIEVMMPSFRNPYSKSASGPILLLQTLLRIKENHVVNLGPGGTGVTAETWAQQVLAIIHQWGSIAGVSYFPSDTPLSPNRDFHPSVCYDVTLWSDFPVNQIIAGGTAVATVSTVTITESAPLQCTLACPTGGATIYYTTDGSLPGPGNAAAQVYSAPFAVAVLTTVRAAAYQAGLIGSSITAVQFIS